MALYTPADIEELPQSTTVVSLHTEADVSLVA